MPPRPSFPFAAARTAERLRAFFRGLDGLGSNALVRAALFASYALVLTWPLLGQAGLVNQFRDAQLLGTYERDAVHAVRAFHSWPFWDPFLCGGLYALGSPQTRFASPTFLVSLLVGADRAEPLLAFAFIWLGLEGTFRWSRRLGAGSAASLLAAPLFAASGTFAASAFLGWTSFYGFALCPWVLLGWRGALRGELRGAALAAGAWAWMVGFGGTYAAPMIALVCALMAVEAALRCRDRHSLTTLVGGAGFTTVLALGLGCVRLWPLLETMHVSPRVLGDHPGHALPELWRALSTATRIKGGNVAGARMYTLGAWYWVPAVATAIVLRRRRALFVATFGLLALWAAAGYASPPGPFRALRMLPVFASLRYPERYLVLVALAASGLAALGVHALLVHARARRDARHRVSAFLAALVVIALLVASGSYLADNHHLVAASRLLDAAPTTLARPFRQARGNRWSASLFPFMERGSLQCWEAYPVPMSPALRADLPAEESWSGQGRGTASRVAWAPDRLAVRVSATTPGVLRINQNFHPGWRSDRGRVFSDSGLLAVALPAGEQLVNLRFAPRSGFGGLAVTVASLLALLVVAWRARRRASPAARAPVDQATWLALSLPASVLAVCLLLIAEPPREPLPPVSPSGAILEAGPPSSSTPLSRTFDNLTLEAVSATSAPRELGEGNIRVELWWRRTGEVKRSPLTVRLVLRAGARTLADRRHELVSAWRPLHALPLGVAVLDEVFLPVETREAGLRAELFVEVTDAAGSAIGAGGAPVLRDVALP